jgi:hypothetical protein
VAAFAAGLGMHGAALDDMFMLQKIQVFVCQQLRVGRFLTGYAIAVCRPGAVVDYSLETFFAYRTGN